MRSGFSLIELVVVLALIGVTAAFAVPAFHSVLSEDESHAAVRDARALLENARSIALERGTRVQLVVDSIDGQYWLIADRDSARTGRLDTGPDARLDLSHARARFTWDAHSAPAADTLVFVTSSGRVRLTLDRWSGQVQVHAR